MGFGTHQHMATANQGTLIHGGFDVVGTLMT